VKIEYKIQDKFDFAIFIPTLILVAIGLIAIFSSTINHPTASGNFERQLSWAIISVAIFFIIYFLPPQTFKLLAIPSYAVSIFFLIIVIFLGSKIYGARSWINIGPFGFQPSEFAKIGLIFFLSYWLTQRDRDINNLKDIGVALLIGVFPILLILMEPDMGTAIVYSLITLALIFWAGISLFGLFVVLAPALVIFASMFGTHIFILSLVLIIAALFYFKKNLFLSAGVFVMNMSAGFFFDYGFKLLKPHQQNRITSFINPAADPLGSGYNALQAKVAIGSGGLIGKGFLEGNQTQLRFIPEQWTDFIYCVIGEEFGFIGSVLTILLFIIIFVRLLHLSAIAKDRFSSLVVIGILTMLFINFAINIGMNIGITPVIGLPLPMVSYGGSSLLVNISLLAVALNIYKNRKQRA